MCGEPIRRAARARVASTPRSLSAQPAAPPARQQHKRSEREAPRADDVSKFPEFQVSTSGYYPVSTTQVRMLHVPGCQPNVLLCLFDGFDKLVGIVEDTARRYANPPVDGVSEIE